MSEQVRPTKKQRELLTFIQNFVGEHGYGPSYREIMVGCDYSSPATVALHVNNLVARGHLRKKGRSARSIELVDGVHPSKKTIPTNIVSKGDEKWLVEQIEFRLNQADNGQVSQNQLDELYVLVGALKVLGFSGAASALTPRLAELKTRVN